MRRVALGNHEETVGQGGVCTENAKTNADKEKAGKQMLTVPALSAGREARKPNSVQSYQKTIIRKLS